MLFFEARTRSRFPTRMSLNQHRPEQLRWRRRALPEPAGEADACSTIMRRHAPVPIVNVRVQTTGNSEAVPPPDRANLRGRSDLQRLTPCASLEDPACLGIVACCGPGTSRAPLAEAASHWIQACATRVQQSLSRMLRGGVSIALLLTAACCMPSAVAEIPKREPVWELEVGEVNLGLLESLE